jgi:hypothetical protein
MLWPCEYPTSSICLSSQFLPCSYVSVPTHLPMRLNKKRDVWSTWTNLVLFFENMKLEESHIDN